MKKRHYSLGKNIFQSKSAARSVVQTIMNTHPHDKPILNNDLDIVLSAAQQHHHYEEKFLKPVDYITTTKNPHNSKYNTFKIVYKDGTDEYLSFMKMWMAPHFAQKSNFVRAARNAVQPSIEIYKDTYFRHALEYWTKDLVRSNCVVHHDSPLFSTILSRYVDRHGMPEIYDKGDHYEFSSEQAEHFREFHDSMSCLRVLTPEEHIRIHKERAWL